MRNKHKYEIWRFINAKLNTQGFNNAVPIYSNDCYITTLIEITHLRAKHAKTNDIFKIIIN